ncbi:MAG: diguanylate cyclase [Verrucomicrobiota bacterium]|nr:diguanylate cyclase [Verrucomicrobiota bacterium]
MSNPDPFVEEDSRVLTPDTFAFVLSNELKRAARSANFLTLVLVAPTFRGVPGNGHGESDDALREVARLVSREVRETDLLSYTDHGRLSVVLLDADMETSMHVIKRLTSRLENYQFEQPLSFEICASCCPTHGVDAESLKLAAEAHRMRKGGPEASPR